MSSQQLYCPTATRSVNDKNVPNLVFALGMDLIRVDEREEGLCFQSGEDSGLAWLCVCPSGDCLTTQAFLQ